MTRGVRTISIVVALALAAWLFGGRLLGFKSWDWHQKLVLEVNTPHGLVSGGSTVALHVSIDPKWLPSNGGGGHNRVVGEASFVQVAPGKYLVALLRSQDETDRALYSFFQEGVGLTDQSENLFNKLELGHGSAAVPHSLYPTLVTFDDPSDPKSVKKVDPYNLAATFGPGVSLQGITLEITKEPVTDGKIATVLPWLAEYYGQALANFPKTSPNDTMPWLSSGAFKTKG